MASVSSQSRGYLRLGRVYRTRPVAFAETSETDPLFLVADAEMETLRENLVNLFEWLRATFNRAPLDRIIASGRSVVAKVTELANLPVFGRFEQDLRGRVWESIRESQEAGGEVARRELPDRAGLNWRFDAVNPRAVEWAEQHVAQRVTEVTDTTKQAIRAIVTPAVEGDYDVRTAGRLIRSVVGLHSRDALAVEKYYSSLLSQDMSDDRAGDLVGRYAARLLRQRAETIARTETIDAVSAGQEELWKQAMERGTIVSDQTRMRWVVTHDERLCHRVCAPMSGQEVEMGGLFTTGDGRRISRPTAHTRCRCRVRLVFDAPLPEPVDLPEPSWVDKVNGRIEQGIKTDLDAIDVGRMVLEEQRARLAKQHSSIDAEIQAADRAQSAARLEVSDAMVAQREWLLAQPLAVRQQPTAPDESRDKLAQAIAKRNAAEAALQAAQMRRQHLDVDTLRQVLEEIRPFGLGGNPAVRWRRTGGVVEIAPPSTDLETRIVDALDHYPRAWARKAARGNPIAVRESPRGYYQHGRAGYATIIALSERREVGSVEVHEVGHRMEAIFPAIQNLEKQFYLRRTINQPIEKMGPGYGDSELTIPDAFAHRYIGRIWLGRSLNAGGVGSHHNGKLPPGAGEHFEVLSMGFEAALARKGRIVDWDADPEFREFVIGVLAGT